ncbi:MAG: tetratricopeptide repeat protein, partial [Candidatus Methylomirabilaceae bacterium]
EDSVAMRREVGDRRGLAYTLGNLAQNAHERGDDVSARALLEEALTIQREVGDKRGIAYSLERFASLAGANGRHERAARLFGAAEALRERIGAPLSPADRVEYDHGVSAVRAALTGAVLEAAWAQGRAMTQEQAVEFALAPDA